MLPSLRLKKTLNLKQKVKGVLLIESDFLFLADQLKNTQ